MKLKDFFTEPVPRGVPVGTPPLVMNMIVRIQQLEARIWELEKLLGVEERDDEV